MRLLGLVWFVSEVSEARRIDLASVELASAWSANLAAGEASFDAFVQHPSNPVYTGSGDEQWPVNGFLYGGSAGDNMNQTLYIGLYGAGYRDPWSMLGIGSVDGGQTWDVSTGPLICSYNTTLFNISHGCPDGSAVDDGNGGVHMVFDWNDKLGAGTTDNGIGYQHCITPLGPCTISTVPVNRMTDNKEIFPGYITTYGGTLLKRKDDWVVLSAISTRGNAGGIWALASMVSSGPNPDPAVSGTEEGSHIFGPYSSPTLLLYPESDTWHPHPCEFYPCFAHGADAYCPCTSLQKNHGMQVLYTAPLELAHLPESWTVYQSGSFYHWEGDEKAAFAPGIFGQTFSGFVDSKGGLQLMYPALSPQGFGTINLAKAANFTALRSSGFWVSAPADTQDQVAVFSKTFDAFTLKTVITAAASGVGGWSLRWNWRGSIGPDGAPFCGASMSPRALSSNTALAFDGKGHFSVVQIDDAGTATYLKPPSSGGSDGNNLITIDVNQTSDGFVSIKFNGTTFVDGLKVPLAAVGGSVAVHAGVGSSLHVTEMVVDIGTSTTDGGRSSNSSIHRSSTRSGATEAVEEVSQRYLKLTASEGIVGQGSAALSGWTLANDHTYFQSNAGFINSGATNRTIAKWNFVGVACKLWLPRGPSYGTVSVSVDGGKATLVNLVASQNEHSTVVYEWKDKIANPPAAPFESPKQKDRDVEHDDEEKEGKGGVEDGVRARVHRQQRQHRHALVVRWISGETEMAADTVEYLPQEV